MFVNWELTKNLINVSSTELEKPIISLAKNPILSLKDSNFDFHRTHVNN